MNAFESFLSSSDNLRGLRTFSRLARHDISRWALTGGLAVELHILQRGGNVIERPLNDIDFIASSFDDIGRA